MFIEATAPLIMVQIAIEKKIFMRDLPSLMMTTDFPTSVNWVRLLIALEGTETWCGVFWQGHKQILGTSMCIVAGKKSIRLPKKEASCSVLTKLVFNKQRRTQKSGYGNHETNLVDLSVSVLVQRMNDNNV